MSSLSRMIPVLAAGAIALAVACGGDSTGPSASSVTGIAGDNQEAPAGTPLAFPLSFVVLGASSQPLPGVTVNWTVTPTGGATFSPVSAPTDAQGTAATNVTLGAFVGEVVIRGNVPGIQPVVFHAVALDPCTILAAYTFGATVSGALARTDCKLNGYFYDFYELDLPPGQQSLRISMASTRFDTYVELFRLNGDFLGADDDIQAGVIQDSQLDVILGDGGTYVIGANSFDPDTVGAYTLSTAQRPANLGGCQDAWATPGVTFIDSVKANDCVTNGFYYDRLWIWAEAGTVLRFSERSTAFNALLTLYRANFQTQTLDSVAANDDSTTGNTNSYIAYTVTVDGQYFLRIGNTVAGAIGEYTLNFASNTAAGPTAGAGPPGPRVLRLNPFRATKEWTPLPRGRGSR